MRENQVFQEASLNSFKIHLLLCRTFFIQSERARFKGEMIRIFRIPRLIARLSCRGRIASAVNPYAQDKMGSKILHHNITSTRQSNFFYLKLSVIISFII